MTLHLHIEHLLLDGLPLDPSDAPALQAAVDAELTRLCTDGARSSPQVGDLQLAEDATPTTIGGQIGRALHGAVHR